METLERKATRNRRTGRLMEAPSFRAGIPLKEQIATHFRDLIFSGAVSPGSRLPGRRTLARDLRVSGNTILSVVQQLASEGLVETREGSGTFVTRQAVPFRASWRAPEPAIEDGELLPLEVGVPAAELFPMKVWSRLQARRWERLPAAAFGEGDPAGWRGLREIIAQRVAALRGVPCDPDRVIITAGAQACVGLAGRVLGRAGECAWVEDPGYWRSIDALTQAGLTPVPVAVDGNGIDIARARSAARLALVTPARQFPTGVVLSSERRRALIAWARATDGWIIEDDYEFDFCFEGRLPGALAAEAPDRVVYVSTFSPNLFPALRLGYLIAPDAVMDRFLAVRAAVDRMVNTPLQMVLQDFMEAGHFAAHVRRCRSLYAGRRTTLIDSLTAAFGATAVRAPATGLHVTLRLDKGVSDRALKDAALARGVVVNAISDHARLPVAPGLFLGFAAHAPDQIRQAVDALAAAHAEVAAASC